MRTQIEELARHFKIVGEEFKKGSSASLKNNFSLRDLRILEFLADGKKTMSQIAKEMSLTPGTITTAIDSLIEKKYVKREMDKIDRRKIYISLLKKGREIADIMFQQHLEIAKRILKILDKEERDFFLKILNKISNNIEKS